MSRLTGHYKCEVSNKILEALGIDNLSKEDIQIIKCDNELCSETCERVEHCEECPIQEAIAKLAEYEDTEEQGLLLRLPYNIATCGVVYYVDEKDREIYRLQADKIEIYKMMISNKFVYTIDCYDFFYEDFGKIVFTTEEQAEAALKKMQEDK